MKSNLFSPYFLFEGYVFLYTNRDKIDRYITNNTSYGRASALYPPQLYTMLHRRVSPYSLAVKLPTTLTYL